MLTTASEWSRIQSVYQQHTLGKTITLSQFVVSNLLSKSRSVSEKGSAGKMPVDQDLLRSLRIDLNRIKNEIAPIAGNYNQSVKRINGLFVSAELQSEVGQANQIVAQLPPLLSRLHELLDRLNETLAESN